MESRCASSFVAFRGVCSVFIPFRVPGYPCPGGWPQARCEAPLSLCRKAQHLTLDFGIFRCRTQTLQGQWLPRSPVNTPGLPHLPRPARVRGCRSCPLGIAASVLTGQDAPWCARPVRSHLHSEGWSRGSPRSVYLGECYIPTAGTLRKSSHSWR